jgi:hypothetical protein
MSRSCYSEDFGDDFPGQMELFRANVERSFLSKAGQARLRELRDSLLALPVKELHADLFAEGTREAPKVCLLGAWALAKTGGDIDAAGAMVPTPEYQDEPSDTIIASSLKSHGWPRLVVLDAVFFNDEARNYYEHVEGPSESPYAYYGDYRGVSYRRDETPAERYERMLTWVNEQLSPQRTSSHD